MWSPTHPASSFLRGTRPRLHIIAVSPLSIAVCKKSSEPGAPLIAGGVAERALLQTAIELSHEWDVRAMQTLERLEPPNAPGQRRQLRRERRIAPGLASRDSTKVVVRGVWIMEKSCPGSAGRSNPSPRVPRATGSEHPLCLSKGHELSRSATSLAVLHSRLKSARE
jgi:hypothetical protein